MRRLTLLCLLCCPLGARAQNGLTGQYYDTAAFGTLLTTRTDATIGFDWGTAIPAGTALTNADTFSVAWLGQIEPEFSQLYTFYVTADDGARLWVNDQLVVAQTFAATPLEVRGQVALKAGQRVNLRLEYVEQTGTAKVKLEWSSASRAREVIPTERLFPARVDKAGGALLKEHWSGIAGDTLSALTSNANYPNKPGGREFITSFECLAQDWSDSYGTRVTGYIVPPVTGNYTFAVSGDDVAELYLSSDATSANKALIASVATATGFRVWTAQPAQQSTVRTLTQGQRYYVELLHKENTGTDHWSVGWMPPGASAFSVVPGSALVQPGLTTAQPAETALLNTMAQDHPRIFATAERFAKLRATWLSAATSPPKTWAQAAITSANTILTQAPVAYTQDIRGTILDQSRTAKDRMYKLGVAWQLTGDSQYAERAWTELNTVAAFPDWHPPHFLDTAEMTHACAIGYDWFYAYWTQARRDTIRTAIINKGLTAGLAEYTGNVGWSRSTGNNWNMVCNGGLSIGALAVGAESETLAENILNRALNSTRPVWKHFTTDCGNWYEGPGYWGYTTEYGIRMFAALEWVLGSDFGISSTQGVSESGFAPIESTGPTNLIFNYADSGAGAPARGPVYQWMARRYGQPLYDWWENQGSGGALDALWFNDSTATLQTAATPPDMAFHGDAGTAYQPQEMVTLRGKWNDSRASFIGTKGGQMGADHGNLDAGTFVLDALGKRWFHDLGGDDYALPGYFSSASSSTGTDRWDYYRMRSEGQNTLTINPSANADMVLNAVAPLIAYQSEPGGSSSYAIHDLTSVYSGMTRVWRGTRLLGARNQMLVQDEIQAAAGKTVWWFAHYTSPTTTVVIDPDGTSATLTQGSERLWCKIVSGGGSFQVVDAVPLASSPNPAGQNANTGYKKLAIQLSNVTNTTLAVWFVPLATGDAVPTALPTTTTLNSWNLAVANDAPNANTGGATGNGDNAVDIDLCGYVTDDTTPPEQMRFSVSGGVNGTVILLADGHTARFTPTPGYAGVPSFSFTATDTTPDPRVLVAYDFDQPDAASATTVPDVSGHLRDGAIDFAGAGVFQVTPDQPAALVNQGGRSLDLTEDGTNAARLKRTVTAAELDWNAHDWTVSGWFKRRDTTNDDFVWHIAAGDGFGSTNEIYVNCPAGSSTVRLQHHNGTAFDVDLAQTGIAAGVWQHFSVVRSGTTLSFYVNGTLAGTDDSFTFVLDPNAPLVFGGHADPSFQPGRWFDGQLDDLAVFSAALPPADLTALAGGLTVRHFGGLSATGSITLATTPVTYLWNNATAGSILPWSTATNWAGASAPTSSRGAVLQFFTGQTLTGGTITSNRDPGGTFVLNNLTLAGTTSTATTATITGGGLTFLNNGLLNPGVTLSANAGSGFTCNLATPITLGANTTFSGSGTATVRISGAIDGAGALLKTSSGTLTLTGSNTYTGDTLISSGILQIGADGATGSLGTGGVTTNATLRFDRTGTLVVPNNIGGTGSLYIDCPISAGTIVLSGSNSFSGGVVVYSGALRITNSYALGDGTKTITLTNGTAGNPQLRLDGSSDPIELPVGISFQTSNDSSSGAIISEAGNNVISGSISLNSGGGSTGIHVNSGTLTLDGNIAPITTNRSLNLYGAGSGTVNGIISNGTGANVMVSLNKSEAGTWTLAGANAYSASTAVNAGKLVLGHPSALGNGGLQFGNTTGGTTVASGATLDLSGQPDINEILTLSGTGIGAAGALVNANATPASIASGLVSAIATTAGGVHSAVPNVTLSGGGGSGAAATASLGVTAASFTIAGGTTVYSGAPTVTISGGGGNGATATAVLTGGTTGVVTGITLSNAGAGFTSAPAIAFAGGTITTAGTAPTGTGNANNFVVSGCAVSAPGSGYTTAPSVAFSSGSGTAATAHLSAVILGAATSLGGSGDIAINPGISGGFAVTKTGAGVLTLAGTNSYTGATTVAAGALLVQSPGSLSASSAVTVNSGGVLGGNGTINSTVNLLAGAALAPGGANALGTLTLASGSASALTLNGNSLLFDISTVAGSDKIAIAGSLVLKGANTLALALAGGFTPPGTYTLMTYAAKTGTGTLVLSGSDPNATLTVGATSVTLTVATPQATWQGNLSAIWDTGTANWLRNASPATYVVGDAVLFDDTATANFVISGDASPVSVTVNNSDNSYELAGSLSGTGTSLLKSGGNVLILSGANTYTGPTTVTGGTLRVTGSLASSVTVATTATLHNSGTITAPVTVLAGGTYLGGGTLAGDLTNSGLVTLDGGALIVTGNLTSTGTIRLTGGATLAVTGTLTNHGTLDLMTATQTLPAGFINHGVVLNSSNIRVTSSALAGADFTVTLTGYAGHTYQLQRADSLTAATWTALGTAQPGSGTVLALTDAGGATGPQRFYRVRVSP